MSCASPVPVGFVCPVCGRKHRSKTARALYIAAGTLAVVSLSGLAVYVYLNRRRFLYDSNYQPVFRWVSDLPISASARGDDPGSKEKPPRNYSSVWR